MRTFLLGLTVGLGLSAIGAQAGSLYDRSGQPAAPRGSIQQFDYFRQRQQQLDIGAMRQQADRDRLNQAVRPCRD